LVALEAPIHCLLHLLIKFAFPLPVYPALYYLQNDLLFGSLSIPQLYNQFLVGAELLIVQSILNLPPRPGDEGDPFINKGDRLISEAAEELEEVGDDAQA
jgi:hypothetical protein